MATGDPEVTYYGLATLIFRLLGVISIAAVIPVSGMALAGPAAISGVFASMGFFMLPGVAAIVFSKPLGQFVAAGLDQRMR